MCILHVRTPTASTDDKILLESEPWNIHENTSEGQSIFSTSHEMLLNMMISPAFSVNESSKDFFCHATISMWILYANSYPKWLHNTQDNCLLLKAAARFTQFNGLLNSSAQLNQTLKISVRPDQTAFLRQAKKKMWKVVLKLNEPCVASHYVSLNSDISSSKSDNNTMLVTGGSE